MFAVFVVILHNLEYTLDDATIIPRPTELYVEKFSETDGLISEQEVLVDGLNEG